MWIGTFGGGLDLALPDSNNRYKFKHFFQYIHGVSEIRTLLEDENGMFWMGTSNGICLFHPDSLISNPNNYHLFSHTNGRFCSNSIIYLFKIVKTDLGRYIRDGNSIMLSRKQLYQPEI